jgi:putative holliday junction resolvase
MTERAGWVKAARVYSPRMRLLGLDVGDKTIGVALSDESATLASGLPTIRRTRLKNDLRQLADLARGREVGTVVVGLPRSLDGSEGPQAQKVRAFVEALKGAVKLPVVTWDERLTTVAAEHALVEGGVSRARRKGLVDKVAAVLILQNYLDYRKAADGEAGEPTA